MTKYVKYIDEIPTKEEALELLNLKGSDITALLYVADRVREKYCGDEMNICTITNAKSGKCSENCKFCAQSSHYETNCNEYAMADIEKLNSEYLRSIESGAEHFDIVASGRDLIKGTVEFETVVKFLESKRGDKIKFCISAGNIGDEEAKIMNSPRRKRTGYLFFFKTKSFAF